MTEKLKLSELVQPEFRTSEAASLQNEELARRLGTDRYGPARLALALSLADKRPVNTDLPDTKGSAIRGRSLFGKEADMAAWIALVTHHAGRELDKHEFMAAVAKHWERGIGVLFKMWEGANGDFDRFIAALAEKSGMPAGSLRSRPVTVQNSRHLSSPSPIDLRIGELTTGVKQGQMVDWRINAPGHSPHIAVMGASGGGKTRLALEFAQTIQAQSGCPTLIFDMKGDIAENTSLCQKIGAEVIDSPDTPIPLDILHVANRADNSTIQNTASRLCQSLTLVMRARGGDVQTDRLRRVAAEVIGRRDNISIPDLRESLKEHYQENDIKDDSVVAALNRICDFNLFAPVHSPDDFFGRSWIFAMNRADEGIRRFAALMILDALDRHFTALPEAQVDAQDNRQITTLLVVDEAHKILNFQHSALSNIIRVSRSKGGAVILISQSPNDYVREDANFVENIGLVASYQTNATPASIKKVFSMNFPVANLGKGMCAIRISGESPQKVKVWE